VCACAEWEGEFKFASRMLETRTETRNENLSCAMSNLGYSIINGNVNLQNLACNNFMFSVTRQRRII